MSEDLTTSRATPTGTKGFRPFALNRPRAGAGDADSRQGGETVVSTFPGKRPSAARRAVRHKVSGTNRRARSA